ncbi:MAG: transaldolase, partial [Vicinamibacterales bacterium]
HLRVATTVGYGPQYLHSTGQLHKGGANSGLFLLLTTDPGEDLPIPGEPYGFGTLQRAQALGDYRALVEKGRRVLRVDLRGDVERAMRHLNKCVQSTARREATNVR